MRETKVLLKLLRDRIKDRPDIQSGLCNEVMSMYCERSLTHIESNFLLDYIKFHRPKRGKHFVEWRKDRGWYWDLQLVEPRLAWLNDQIKNFHHNR